MIDKQHTEMSSAQGRASRSYLSKRRNMAAFLWIAVCAAVLPLAQIRGLELENFCSVELAMTSLENCTCSYLQQQIPHEKLPMCSGSGNESDSNMTLETFCELNDIAAKNCHCVYVQEHHLFETLPATCKVVTSLAQLCRLLGEAPENCTCDVHPDSGFCEKSGVTVVFPFDAAYERAKVCISLLAASAGIVGNCLVVAATVNFRKGLTLCRFVIAVLAGTDLFFAVMQVISSVPNLWTNKWVYGEVLCKILSSFTDLGALIAVGLILIIAIERYVAIVRPYSRGLSRSVTYAMLCTNTVAGVCWVIPLLVVLHVQRDTHTCEEAWTTRSELVYSWLSLIFYFLLPITVIFYLYLEILKVLYARGHVPGIPSVETMDKRKRDNRRIMAILVCVLVAFILFVFPNRLVWVILGHAGRNHSLSQRALNYAAMLTYPLHVMINPVIYTLADSKLRKNMKAILLSCFPTKGRKGTLALGLDRSKSSSSTNDERVSMPLSTRKKISEVLA